MTQLTSIKLKNSMDKELSKDTENASSANLTAVEWLIQEIKNDQFVKSKNAKEWNEIFDKAKEMEKEKMIQFCIDWFASREMNIREYYNQTYGGDK